MHPEHDHRHKNSNYIHGLDPFVAEQYNNNNSNNNGNECAYLASELVVNIYKINKEVWKRKKRVSKINAYGSLIL